MLQVCEGRLRRRWCGGTGASALNPLLLFYLLLVLEDGSSLECVNRFCKLGDMLGAAGDCGEASKTRVEGLEESSRSLQSC